MDTQVILWFVLLATLFEPHCLLAKLQYFTFKDEYLPGHIYRSLSTADWSECLQACAVSESCVSYSFEKRRKGSENCHLHACSFLNECAAVKNLIASQGTVFQQLKSIEEIQESQTRSILCLKNKESEPIQDVALTIQNVELCPRTLNQTSIEGATSVITTTICGNKKKKLLGKCTKFNNKRMHLESLKYVRCNCSCEACDEIGDLCSMSSLFLKVARKCQGRKKCRVQIKNECEDDILRSLRVSYICI